jgi:hypothetical protein
MADHHPDAAEVLAEFISGRDPDFWYPGSKAADLLNALAAAGLAVVKVGEVPPWMVEWDKDWFHSKTVIDRESGHFVADGYRPEARIQRLYVIKEQDR